MNTLRILCFSLFSLIAASAYALDLQGARDQGILGEKSDGYVAVVKQAPGADQLAAEVNTRRKAEYLRISKEQNQPADVVAKLAAAQIVQKLTTGNKYQDANGGWNQK
jgi:uncharacterized protein